jgi:hypothetical protein
MSLETLLGVVALAALVVLVALLAWTFFHRKASLARMTKGPGGLPTAEDLSLEEGERQASLVTEQIEEMVKHKLAAYPDLGGVRVDFGTAADGGLEIWFGDVRYETVDQIPDARVRAAVAEAVASYNQ